MQTLAYREIEKHDAPLASECSRPRFALLAAAAALCGRHE